MFRIYYRLRGGHVHMRFFVGAGGVPGSKAGDLVMTVDEFRRFRDETRPAIRVQNEGEEDI